MGLLLKKLKESIISLAPEDDASPAGPEVELTADSKLAARSSAHTDLEETATTQLPATSAGPKVSSAGSEVELVAHPTELAARLERPENQELALKLELAEQREKAAEERVKAAEQRAKAAERELELREQVLCLQQQQQQLVPLDNSADLVVCVRCLVGSFFFGSLLHTRDACTT